MLQVFFLNNYYEAMKIQQTTKLANQIIDSFQRGNKDLMSLTENLQGISAANSDIYIRVETGSRAILISPDYSGQGPQYLYSLQVEALAQKLQGNKMDKVSIIYDRKEGGKTGILSYACYLHKETSGTTSEENFANSYILYIFSPLYPMESTVAILRAQLIYITLIAALLALALAIYLANRISRPIKDITNSAAEMGKGHYGIIFKGGHYSEISNLASTLTNASRELEKTDMYQKDLIANVSHDLRTPLTMIKSYAEMVRDLSGNNPEKREAHLNVIIEETDRLNTLVNDMLNMSRMQSKKIILEKADFNIKHTAETLLTSYEILSENEGYKFNFTCPAPIVVNGDEAKVKQVITNLINNAVKYCGIDKEIAINIKRSGRKMRCEIIDHGAGISPDEINHVWERYYKSSTHHVRPTDGSGLGLSIVREILSLHKADYGVISKLDKGSTFWFEMDIVKANRNNEPRLKAR